MAFPNLDTRPTPVLLIGVSVLGGLRQSALMQGSRGPEGLVGVNVLYLMAVSHRLRNIGEGLPHSGELSAEGTTEVVRAIGGIGIL